MTDVAERFSVATPAPGLQKAGCSLTILPDKLIIRILEHASCGTLLKLSHVCRSLHPLVKPFLFQDLNLGSHNLSYLSRMYLELFQDRSTGQSGPLKNLRVRTLNYKLYEPGTNNRDSLERLEVFLDILHSVKSVELLSLHVCLTFEGRGCMGPRDPLPRDFLPLEISALARLRRASAHKVKGYELYFFTSPQSGSCSSSKIIKLCEIYSRDPVVALHFSELPLANLPSNLETKLEEPCLRSLTVQGNSSFLASMRRPSNLSRFDFSWDGGYAADSGTLDAALRIINSSATSLRRLKLKNASKGQLSSVSQASLPTQLAHLQWFDIHDKGIGEASILGYFLTYTQLPELQTLKIELEDIINLDCDATWMLNMLPNIKYIELVEQKLHASLKRAPVSDPMYKILEAECLARGISLKTNCSVVRCEESQSFERGWTRLNILSRTLASLDITVKPRALEQIHTLSPLHLPSVQEISLCFTAEVDLDRTSALSDFLECAVSSSALCLKIDCSLSGELAPKTVQTLAVKLKTGSLPSLQEIRGSIRLRVALSPGGLLDWKKDWKQAWRSVGVGCSGLEVRV